MTHQRLHPDGDVPPIAFEVRMLEGYDPEDPGVVGERCLTIVPTMHPDLAHLLNKAGASRIGETTWVVGLDKQSHLNPLRAIARAARPGSILPQSELLTRSGNPVVHFRGSSIRVLSYTWDRLDVGVDALPNLKGIVRDHSASMTLYKRGGIPFDIGHGFVSISANGRTMYISAVTMESDSESEAAVKAGEVDSSLVVRTNLRQPGRNPYDPRPSHPAAVAQTVKLLSEGGAEVLYTPEAEAVLQRLENQITLYPAPGRPAEIAVYVGSEARRIHQIETVINRLVNSIGRESEKSVLYGVRSISRVEQTLSDLNPAVAVYMHPKVEDLHRLAQAKPFTDPNLRDYQQEMVGMHLATKYGLVNCLEPGMGKTVTTLVAIAERARHIPNYKALVVVEANVRSQWAGEAATWAPNLNLTTVYGAEDAPKLAEALQRSDPQLIITSYSMAGRIAELIRAEKEAAEAAAAAAAEEAAVLAGGNYGKRRRSTHESEIAAALAAARAQRAVVETPTDEEEEEEADPNVTSISTEMGVQGSLFDDHGKPTQVALLGMPAVEKGDASVAELLDREHWHDLVADEAAVLRNPGSSQTKALWRLRAHSDIAIALTGTPITRNGVDDLGRLIAWTRNDPTMFVGAKLSNQFDVATDKGMRDFYEAVGVLVFRRNKADIAEELPGLTTDVVMLEPTAEELSLAAAAQEELKRVYLELVALMELVEEGHPDDERVKEAKEAMRAARGAWLGGTQLARMAAADPASLIRSTSAGAELLRSSGLIEAANRVKGTKRSWVIDHTKKRVADNKQVIIFTEFATVATGLINDLKAEGVRVEGVLGGGGRARDANVEAFRNGELDVLVCTSAGKRGLNLQTAATVIHYDLPWTPDDVAQRTARVERIGATADEVEVLFVVAKGTIEERVVALLATRAATAVRALDISRGADGSSTDMGRILAGIIDAVDGSHLDEKQWNMLEITRELVGA